MFGTAPDGSPVERIEIQRGGATAAIISWGATLQDFRVESVPHSLVLGSQDLAAYLGPMKYFGAVVGPVANRISGGQLPGIKQNGAPVQLEKNEAGRTTLHGGPNGFGERNWDIASRTADSVTLTLADQMRSGFPGNIKAQVTYQLDDQGALTVEIGGAADAPVWFGPAFHGYWNLDGLEDLSGHRLTVFANQYTPVDAELIPTGETVSVADGQFDYRQPQRPAPDLDHNFCIAMEQGDMRPACVLETDVLTLTVETTEVGVQIYSGSGIETDPFLGHGGLSYGANAGIAIEPQFWPDTPNNPVFPSSLLASGSNSGQTYKQVSRFAVTRN